MEYMAWKIRQREMRGLWSPTDTWPEKLCGTRSCEMVFNGDTWKVSHSFLHGYTVGVFWKKEQPFYLNCKGRAGVSCAEHWRLNVLLTVAIAAKNAEYIWRKTAVLTSMALLLWNVFFFQPNHLSILSVGIYRHVHLSYPLILFWSYSYPEILYIIICCCEV